MLLGQFVPSCFPLNVRQMSHRVRDWKRMTPGSVKRHSLLIMPQGIVDAALVPLNLPQSGERPRQLSSITATAIQRDHLNQIALSIREPMVSSRLQSLLKKFVGCV